MLLLLACAEPTPSIVWTDRALAWSTFPRADDDYEPIVGPAGDYDGDGVTDLLVMFGEGWEDREVYVLNGPLTGELAQSRITTNRALVGAPGDATGDGIADLVAAEADTEDQPHLVPGPVGDTLAVNSGLALDGSGDGMFSTPTTCDVDGDGVDELLALGGSGRIYDQAGATLATLDAKNVGNAPAAECLGNGAVRFGATVFLDPLGAPKAGLASASEWSGNIHWDGGDLDGDGADDLLVPGDGTLTLVPGPVTSLDGTSIGDACWSNVQQVIGPVDLNQDDFADLLVTRAKGKEQGDCAWDGAGRIELHRGPITGPIGEPDAVLEGGDVAETCHEEGGATGWIEVCDAVVSDNTGAPVASGFPSLGVMPDLDGDGKPELWLVTLSDWQQRTVWVLPGSAIAG